VAKRLLIGNTGFVGGSLSKRVSFSHFENSTSPRVRDSFDEIYCAAPSAIKWEANKYPDRDLEHVNRLIERISLLETRKFFLFSTVDVYSDPAFANEESPTLDLNAQNKYGAHRALLESKVLELFPESLVMRLSGLVDKGLKKNPIFDLGSGNNVDQLNADSQMQFVPLQACWDWLELERNRELTGVVNLTAAPVTLGEVAELVGIRLGNTSSRASYDVRSLRVSKDAEPYLVSRHESVRFIERYLNDAI
jgi:nucleoside-diphosphate-sugar epimerase